MLTVAPKLCVRMHTLSLVKFCFLTVLQYIFYLQEVSSEDEWSFLTESDLISIFDQFPLTELLKSTLSVKEDNQGTFFFHFLLF